MDSKKKSNSNSNSSNNAKNKRRRTDCRGSYQISEFGAATMCLVLLVLLPIVNLSALVVRWATVNSTIDATLHKKAQSEKLSQALAPDAPDGIKKRLGTISGVHLLDEKSTLQIVNPRLPDHARAFAAPRDIPLDRLPDSNSGPYDYSLETNAKTAIEPLVMLPSVGLNIPGLTTPVLIDFKQSCTWENTGRDPVSGEFFLRE